MGIEALLTSQVIGLDAALNGKLSLTGGTLTGQTSVALSTTATPLQVSYGGTSALHLGYYDSGNTTAYVYNYSNGAGLYLGTRGQFQFGIGALSGGSAHRVFVSSTCGISWCSTTSADYSTTELSIFRDAANTLAQRNSTNAQTFRVYNTYTDASNYIRQSLSFTTYSSTVHAQHIVEGAGTGAVNVPFVITPRGTGAFILGPMPDGTSTGGNARGANAVDLQTLRTAATQVASAYSSTTIGVGNTASSSASTAIGLLNTASGTGSFVWGQQNTASGNYSFAGGGTGSTASGNQSFAFSGTASNESSVNLGRDGNVSGAYATGVGLGVTASRYNELAHGFGSVLGIGNNRATQLIAGNKTTNNTATTLFLNGTFASSRITIASGTMFLFTAKIVGVKSDGTSRACYVRKGSIINVAGTTTLVGTIETIGTDVEDNASTDVAITADDTNDALQINVTGITSETWRWVAVVEGVEIAYGT